MDIPLRVESPMDKSARKIAYVLSMKEGLPSFNFREIEGVEAHGFEIHIFPTKISPGLYSPKDSWHVHKPSVLKGILSSFLWLVRKPRTFLRAFAEATREKALPELMLAAQYSREMVRASTTIIHCHFADRKMFMAYFCNLLTGIPYTVTVHSHELVFYANRKLFQKALMGSYKIITICEYNRNLLCSVAHIPDERVVTIRLQVPLDDFKTDDRTKVLTVAKFHDYKGYDTLVDAVRMMKGKRVVFWIVGEGPIDVRGMASDLISAGTVKVFGAVDEELLKILYQACDIFCLPSKTSPSGQKEGLPVSIMEAMAFSKPVVSTAHAGIPELVDTILVPENDPKALADAIEAYMRDPELRNRDGKRNRQAVERLNGSENLDRLVALFESIK